MHCKKLSPSTRRTIGLGAVLIVFLLTVAACGGGGGDNQSQGQDGAATQDARVIEIDSGEFYFEPSEIRVSRGQPVQFVVMNSGSVEHNISIDEFRIDQDYGVDETIRVNFTPNQTGEFRIYCDIPGHTEAGMVGTLIVE